MTVNAIIAEYNPLHNGHVYQMEHAKSATGADYTIALISGNFVQRGAPAIIDKHTRAAMALSAGADMVLELPAIYSSSSAEYFATGSVDLIARLGVADNLCFGSEVGDVELLDEIAAILVEEPEEFKAVLKETLAGGKSYPFARNTALLHCLPKLIDHTELLNSPNNILAIEYLKALRRSKHSMKPFTTHRKGGNYHSSYLGNSFASSQAIRGAMTSDTSGRPYLSQIPEKAGQILCDYLVTYKPITVSDFSDMLFYRLMYGAHSGFTRYLDVSSDLSNRIVNALPQYQNFEQFCDLLKTKEVTYARIARCLMHILLDIKTKDLNPASKLSYIRMLGFRRSAEPLLTAIDNKSSLKILTKPASAKELLSTEDYELFQKQMFQDSIYEYIRSKKAGCAPANEYTVPIQIYED